jgi:hypothetical protein
MKNKYTCPAEKTANEWLAENGICAAQLLKAELELLQAQKIAHNLLKHNAAYLEPKEIAVLNKFLQAMSFANSRKKLSTRHAYKIMNIGTAINRKLFKQHRKLQAAN